jgi:peptidoglycan/LPS O-acetylase OafA/YrhL
VLAYWPGKILWKEFLGREGGGWFAIYLGNFYVLPRNAWPNIAPLTPLWSLQIEEQFYLTFPLLVAIARRSTLKKVLLTMIVIALVVRTVATLAWPDNVLAAYVLMPARMDALAMGGIVALAVREDAAWLRDRRIAWGTAACGFAFLILWRIVGSSSVPPLMRTFGYTLMDAGFAGILIHLIVWKQPWLVRVCRTRVLAWIGTISYGLYLLHIPTGEAMRKYIEPKIGVSPYSSADILLVIAAAIAMALVSWTFIEQPILRFRDRFTARSEAEPLHG